MKNQTPWRIGMGLLFALVSPALWASSHQLVKLPESITLPFKVVPVNAQQFWVTTQTDVGFKWFEFSRQGRGFVESADKEFLFSDLPLPSSANTFSLIAHSNDQYGGYWLIKSERCNAGECDESKVTLLAHNGNGAVDLARPSASFVTMPLTECENTAALYPALSGVWLRSSCETAYYIGPDLGLYSDKDIRLPATGNSQWQSILTSRWDRSNGDEPIPVDPTLWIGQMAEEASDNYFQAQQYDTDGKIVDQRTLALPSSAKNCQLMVNDEPGVFCQVTGEADRYWPLIDGVAEQGRAVTEARDYTDPSEREITTIDRQAILSKDTFHVGHLMSWENSEDESVTTVYDVRSTTHLQSDGEKVQLFNEEQLAEPPSFHGPYKKDPTGYYAIAPIATPAAMWVSVVDGLSVDASPRWREGLGGGMVTDTEQEFTLRYDDDDTRRLELTLTGQDLPDWVTLDESEAEAILRFQPYHDDAGDYNFSLTLEELDGPDPERILDISYHVQLAPYQVKLFEPELFEKLEQEEPLPIVSLVSGLGGRLSFQEDKPITMSLSVEGRLLEELEWTFNELPEFMHWDPESYTLSGTPTQADVGTYDELSLSVIDSFSEPDSETGERNPRDIALPIRIIEIDDPVKITSRGDASITAGKQYYYQLKFSDEETDVSDIDVSIGAKPDWLNYNAAQKSLRGTPTNANIGDHLVQFVVSDDAHVIVHSFTLTVQEGDVEERSGASTGWLFIFLLSLMIVIKMPRKRVRTQ